MMRSVVFHSTLDWVPAEQFDAAAKQAYGPCGCSGDRIRR